MIGLSIPFLLLIVILLALVFGGRKARWIVGGFFCLLFVGGLFLFGVRSSASSVNIAATEDTPGVYVAPNHESDSNTIDMPGLHVSENSRTGTQTIDMPGLHIANKRGSVSFKDNTAIEAPVRTIMPPIPNITPQIPPAPNIVYQSVNSYVDPNDRYASRPQTDQLDPDVYPSVVSAAVGCARQVLKHQGEVVPDGITLGSILIPSQSIGAAEIRSMVQKEFGWLRVVTEETPSTRPTEGDAAQAKLNVTKFTINGVSVPHETSLRAEFIVSPPQDERTTASSMPRTVSIGAASSANFVSGKTYRDAKAVDKEWVEHPIEWKNQRGDDSEYIVIDPSLLGASASEVESNAIAMAAVRVAEFVRNQPAMQNRSSDSLPSYIETELRRHKLIRDEFLQRFERPYGVIYRKALLIDASDEQMGALANQYARLSTLQTQHVNRNAASAVGLIVLIIVVYLFLNAATKGYYVWSLRLGSIAIIAAGIYTVVRLT